MGLNTWARSRIDNDLPAVIEADIVAVGGGKTDNRLVTQGYDPRTKRRHLADPGRTYIGCCQHTRAISKDHTNISLCRYSVRNEDGRQNNSSVKASVEQCFSINRVLAYLYANREVGEWELTRRRFIAICTPRDHRS